MASEEKKPMMGRCGECGHVWPVVYFPMDLERFVNVVKGASICPMCGGENTFVHDVEEG